MCRCGLTQALCLRVPELRHVSGVCARGVAFVAFALALSLGFSGLASAPIVPRSVHRGTVTAGLWPSLPGEPRASVLGLVRQGPLAWSGPNLSFESLQAGYPSVLWDAGVYKMWYFGCTPSYFCQIGYATSQDGRTWTRYGPVLGPSLPQDSQIAAYPEVVKVGATYRMWYGGYNGSNYRILAATSTDGTAWTKLGVSIDLGLAGSQDGYYAVMPKVAFVGGQYMMWYTGVSQPQPPNAAIMLATSRDGLNWTKLGVVLDHGATGALDSFGVFGGDVVFDGSMFRMIYDGQTNESSSTLLYAISTNGIEWQKQGTALEVQPPQERLIAFPSILPLAGRWHVYYTARAGVSDLSFYEASGPDPSTAPAAESGIPAIAIVLVVVVAGAIGTFLFAWYVSRPRRPPPA